MGGPWFETRCCASLLTMRPIDCYGIERLEPFSLAPRPMRGGVRMSKRSGFWFRLGDYISDPWGEFLVDIQARALLRRLCFGAIIALAFWLDANWQTILFFVGLWAVYEGIFYAVRFIKTKYWNNSASS
jgi:hypothetical protein